jgi:broad specificity phosphatase PhoE
MVGTLSTVAPKIGNLAKCHIVYLLRHAESGILAGQDDSVELSKEGFRQAQSLIPYLKAGLLKSDD